MDDAFTEDRFADIWTAFCDGEKHLVPEGFEEQAEKLGLIHFRKVTKSDLQESFAAERGIEKGGSVWELTPIGYIRFLQKKATSNA
jgi:hypothetical protein